MNRKTIVFFALVIVAAFFLIRARGEIVIVPAGGGNTTVVGGNISNTYNFGSQFIVANVTNVALPIVLSNMTATGISPGATNASAYVGSTSSGIGTNTTIYNALTNRGDMFISSNQWVTGVVTVIGLETNRTDLRTVGNLISESNIYAGANLTSATFNVGNSLQIGAATNRSPIGYVMEGSGFGGFYVAGAGGIGSGYFAFDYTDGPFVSSAANFAFRDGAHNTFFILDSANSVASSNLQVNGNLTANLNLNLPAQAPSRVAIINGSSQVVSDSAVTTTELSYLDGLTEALSTSLANKVDEISGVATNITLYGTVTSPPMSADRVAYFDGSKVLTSSVNVDSTELGFLDGVTTPIQTQLNNRVDELSGVATNLTARGINLPTLTASRGLIVDASGNITNITSASPTTEFVRADGTAAVPAGGSGTPAGNSGAVQFNESGNFAGTNRFVYDRTNELFAVIGTTFTNSLAPTGTVARVPPGLPYTLDLVNVSGAQYYFGSNGFYPKSGLGLGIPGQGWGSNIASHARFDGTLYASATILSNSVSFLPRGTTQLGTNVFFDGNVGTVVTSVFNSVSSGLTNCYVTNLNDGQKMRLWLFPSNGVTVGFPQFAAANYLDGAVIPIATNQWTEVEITRRNSETNIYVKSATAALLVGNGLTMTTNFVTREVTLNNTANGVYRTIYIDAAAMVSNVTAGATFLTEQSATPTNRMVDSYVFDGVNSNIVQFKVALPLEWDAGVVKVKLWTWTTNNVATKTNVYGLSATAITNGIVLTNADWGVEQTITNVVSSAGGAVQLSPATTPITVLNANVSGSLVWFRLRRIPQNANDNDDLGQSKVLGAWVQYKQGVTEPSSW